MVAWMDIDWEKLFTFTLPVMEIIVRGSVFYWFLFVVMLCMARDGNGPGMVPPWR